MLVALEALGCVRCIAAKAGQVYCGRKRLVMSYSVRMWVLALCGVLACNRFDRFCVQVLSQIRHLYSQVMSWELERKKVGVDTKWGQM